MLALECQRVYLLCSIGRGQGASGGVELPVGQPVIVAELLEHLLHAL